MDYKGKYQKYKKKYLDLKNIIGGNVDKRQDQINDIYK